MNNVLDTASEVSANVVNSTFSNDFFRLLSIMIVGVFAGYTLRPVPNWLGNLFDTSLLFKFLIILVVGVTGNYPVSKSKMIHIAISSAIILVLFEGLRRAESYMEKKEKK
jgi:hypothetical protein